MPKVHKKAKKKTKKRDQQKEQRDNRRLPWSSAPNCPVHQGTSSQTSHLREFSEALRYNSPDMSGAHRTVSGAPEESDSELASFGNPLRYNSPDCLVSHRTVSGAHRTVRCDSGATTTSRATVDCNALNARLRAQWSRARAGGTPDSPLRQTRGAFGYPLLFLLNPFLGLFIG